jgi:hypothetical protein
MTRCIYREKVKNPLVKVATNYRLNGIEFEFINARDLFEIKNTLKDMILGIDEFHIFMDSRAFMKPSNQQLTHFILQTRHLGVNLYFTTQDISQVDIRLRKQIDFLAYCSGTHIEGVFKVKMVDYRDVLNVRSNDFIYNGRPYYDMYDTTEIIDITNDTPKLNLPKHDNKILTEVDMDEFIKCAPNKKDVKGDLKQRGNKMTESGSELFVKAVYDNTKRIPKPKKIKPIIQQNITPKENKNLLYHDEKQIYTNVVFPKIKNKDSDILSEIEAHVHAIKKEAAKKTV